jgi:hypothetical protein
VQELCINIGYVKTPTSAADAVFSLHIITTVKRKTGKLNSVEFIRAKNNS